MPDPDTDLPLVRIEGRHGTFLTNPNDTYIGRSMLRYGEFSERELQLLLELVGPGAVAVDAGANMGAFTVPLARRVGRSGVVHAIEPQPLVFQQLCANVVFNGLVNVSAVNAFCGDDARWIPVYRLDPAIERNLGGLSLADLAAEEPADVQVRIDRLDDMVDPHRLDLVKADVEGAEIDLLRGALGLIERFRPALYLEHSRVDRAELQRMLGRLRGLGYRFWLHRPPLFNPDNHRGEAHNLFDDLVSHNLLALSGRTAPAGFDLEPLSG